MRRFLSLAFMAQSATGWVPTRNVGTIRKSSRLKPLLQNWQSPMSTPALIVPTQSVGTIRMIFQLRFVDLGS